MPSFMSRAAVTPMPLTHAPPWQMREAPHEGLFSFRYASSAPEMRAICRVSIAPLMNFTVTTAPVSSTMSAVPARTSTPPPLVMAALALGVGRPPSCSGQTGTATLPSRRVTASMLKASLPSYLVRKPKRQALTITGPLCIIFKNCYFS